MRRIAALLVLAVFPLPGGCERSSRSALRPLPPGVTVQFRLAEDGEGDGLEKFEIEYVTRHTRTVYLHGEVLLSETDVAAVSTDESGDPGDLLIHFTEEGSRKFAAVTRANLRRQLAIVVNGTVVSAPVIMEEISNGQAKISGTTTKPPLERLMGISPPVEAPRPRPSPDTDR